MDQKQVMTGLLFACGLVLLSYIVNRRLAGGRLQLEPYRIFLTASAVLLLAVIAESVVNPSYEFLFGSKLWEYRAFPIYGGNVSLLAALIWTAYGIHLHFTLQMLQRRLPDGWNNRFGKSFIIGLEAPLFAEVSGNLTFLWLTGEYYAYYLPSDIGHLTSLRVVPIYMCSIFAGLTILQALESRPRNLVVPPALFAGGVVWLAAGHVFV